MKRLCNQTVGTLVDHAEQSSKWLLKKLTNLIRKINLIMENIDSICVEAPSYVDRPSSSVKLKQFTTLSKNKVD